jgi:hypothetical protein
MVYFSAVLSGSNIAAEPRTPGKRAGQAVDDPVWYASSLSDSSAVGGLLAAGVITCLPCAIAVLAFSLVEDQTRALLNSGQWDPDWPSRLYYNITYIARIPHLILFAMALSIGLCRSRLLPAVPWLVTACATLAAESEGRLFQSWAYGFQQDPLGEGLGMLAWMIGGAMLLSAIAAAGLRWLSSRERPGWLAFIALIACCGMPLLSFVLQIVDSELLLTISNSDSPVAVGYHSYLATHLPDVHLFGPTLQDTSFGIDINPAARLLQSVVCIGGYCMALCFWWFTALACLHAARHRQH